MSALVSVLRLFCKSPLWICLWISLVDLPGIFDFQDLLCKLFCRSALWTQSKNPAQAGFFDSKNMLSVSPVSHLSRCSQFQLNYILLVTSTRDSAPILPILPVQAGRILPKSRIIRNFNQQVRFPRALRYLKL